MYAKAVGEVEKLALIKPAPVNPGWYKQHYSLQFLLWLKLSKPYLRSAPVPCLPAPRQLFVSFWTEGTVWCWDCWPERLLPPLVMFIQLVIKHKAQGTWANWGRESLFLTLMAGELSHSARPGGCKLSLGLSLCVRCALGLQGSHLLFPYFPAWGHNFIGGYWDCSREYRATIQKTEVTCSTWLNSIRAFPPHAFEQANKVLKKKKKHKAILHFMCVFLSLP